MCAAWILCDQMTWSSYKHLNVPEPLVGRKWPWLLWFLCQNYWSCWSMYKICKCLNLPDVSGFLDSYVEELVAAAFTPARGEVLSGSKTMQCWKPFLPQKCSRPHAPCFCGDTPLLASTTSASCFFGRRPASQQLQAPGTKQSSLCWKVGQANNWGSPPPTPKKLGSRAASGQKALMRQSFLMIQWRRKPRNMGRALSWGGCGVGFCLKIRWSGKN